MKGNSMDPMLERIDKLERNVRQFKWAGGVAVSLALFALVMGQKVEPKDTPKVLEVDKLIASKVVTEEFSLMAGNKKVGWWGSVHVGDVGSTQRKATTLVIIPPGEQDFPRLSLSAGIGHASYGLNGGEDKEDFNSAWVCRDDGSVIFTLCTVDDKSVGGIWVSDANGTSFIVTDKEGRNRAVLGRSATVTERTGVKHQRPESSLVLFDEKGNVVHQVP